MKVCICNDVSDRTIREHARAGRSLEQILALTKAGSSCGQCLLAVARIHAAEAAVAAERTPANAPAAGAPRTAA
ncbi:MAG: (2Fe-2S)-binding protein [Anaeromyxobacter sp.]